MVSYFRHITLVFTAIAMTASAAFCGAPWSTTQYDHITNVDYLLSQRLLKQRTIVSKKRDGRKDVYYCVTGLDIDVPADTMKSLMNDVPGYNNHIKFIKRSSSVNPDSNTVFFEVSNGVAVTWFLGNTDSATDTSGVFRRYLQQNRNPELNTQFRKEYKEMKRNGIVTVEYVDFKLMWIVKPLDEGQSRVILVAYLKPKKWIPTWLFRRTVSTIFPTFIRDLEIAAKYNKS
jgi:hypothetical protein